MNEKLEIYPISNSMLNDSIDRIIVKLHGDKQRNGSKAFLFTGVGANVGTTTVAINVAIALADAGWKTAFIDCDFRKSQKYKRIKTIKGVSLTEYLNGTVTNQKNIITETNVKNLDYVLSGEKNDNPVRLLCNANLESFFINLKEKYDFIVIDTPSINNSNDAELLIPLVDKYIFVVCMNETKKKQLINARVQLADYEDKYMGIIANKVDRLLYKTEFSDYDYFSKNNLIKKQRLGKDKRKAITSNEANK